MKTIILPDELRRNISRDESILYETTINGKQSSKRNTRFLLMIFIPFVIICQIIYLIFIELSVITIFVFSFMYLILAFIPILEKLTSKFDTYLVITDQKIYIDRKVFKVENIETLELSSLKAVRFKIKNFNNNLGNIEFVPEYNLPSRTSLKISFIPNFIEIQQIIESIIYEYLKIEQKRENLNHQLKNRFPYEFKLSQQKYMELTKKMKQYFVYTTFSFTISAISISVLFMVDVIKLLLLLLGLLLLTIFGFVVGLVFLITLLYIRRKNTSLDDKLILNEDKIKLSTDDRIDTVLFTPTTSIDFRKLQQVKSGKSRWKEQLDTIIIRESFDTDNKISFGPIDNFPEVYEIIYYILLGWKKKKSYLLSMNQILDVEFRPKLTTIDLSKETLHPEIEITQKESIPVKLIPISGTDPIYKEYSGQLEPNEKIFVRFRPTKKSKKKSLIILFTILVVSLTLAIVFFFRDPETWTIASVLTQVFGSTVCFFSAICICSSLIASHKFKDLNYLLTDRNIILESNTASCVVPYKKISSIMRRIKLGGKYRIEVKLKEPIPNNPYVVRIRGVEINDLFHINNIPNDNDLIDKLRFLMENI